MKLIINGAEREFTEVTTLASLIEQLGMKADRVAIERNRDIVPRDRWSNTNLSDGDRLEIVHFVGGGRDCIFTTEEHRENKSINRKGHEVPRSQTKSDKIGTKLDKGLRLRDPSCPSW